MASGSKVKRTKKNGKSSAKKRNPKRGEDALKKFARESAKKSNDNVPF